MKVLVRFQGILLQELFPAYVARKLPSTVMDMHVTDGIVQILELMIANFAYKGMVPTMYVHMIFQLARINERLIAKGTVKRTHTRVHF